MDLVILIKISHAFDSRTREEEAGRSEFKASVVYRMDSRTARDTERNSLSLKQNKTKRQVPDRSVQAGVGLLSLLPPLP